MANLKAKVRYVLLAALDLAAHYARENPVKLHEISARTNIPPKYLVHILLSLKRRALVNSTRGPKGGYWLMRPPDRITVAEVIDAVESAKWAPPVGESDHGRKIEWLWNEAQGRKQEFLAGITLADALRQGPG